MKQKRPNGAQIQLRQFVHYVLAEAADIWDADYVSPPKIFRDQTGIDVVHDYRLPSGFSSEEALQQQVQAWSDAEKDASDAAWDAWDALPDEERSGVDPFDNTPPEIEQAYRDLANELTRLNPELSIIKWDTGRYAVDNAGQMIMGVASNYPPEDIAFFIGGAIGKDSVKSSEIKALTGYHPGWVLSASTAEEILRQAQQLTENAEDLNEPFAAETLEELFGMGIGKPHKILSPVQKISHSVVQTEPIQLILTLALSDQDGDGIPDIADVKPDVNQHIEKHFPRYTLTRLEPHLHNMPGYMFLRATLG